MLLRLGPRGGETISVMMRVQWNNCFNTDSHRLSSQRGEENPTRVSLNNHKQRMVEGNCQENNNNKFTFFKFILKG